MAARQIKATRKNSDGDITMICNPDESWSPRTTEEVINDIETNYHSYYVMVQGNVVDVHVVTDPGKGKYLRTDRDKTVVNNLDHLPSC